MRSCSTFGAQTSHKQTQTHKTHHGLDLGEVITFPLIIFYVIIHGATPKCHFSRESQVENLEILEIGIPTTFEAHNILCKPLIKTWLKEKL
jgi:hypothetical protein